MSKERGTEVRFANAIGAVKEADDHTLIEFITHWGKRTSGTEQSAQFILALPASALADLRTKLLKLPEAGARDASDTPEPRREAYTPIQTVFE